MQKTGDFPRWKALLKEVLGEDREQKTDDKKSEKGGVNGAATETAKKQA
jgi:hypothetical protein